MSKNNMDRRIDNLHTLILKSTDSINRLRNKKWKIEEEMKFMEDVYKQLNMDYEVLIEERVKVSEGYDELSEEDKITTVAVAKAIKL